MEFSRERREVPSLKDTTTKLDHIDGLYFGGLFMVLHRLLVHPQVFIILKQIRLLVLLQISDFLAALQLLQYLCGVNYHLGLLHPPIKPPVLIMKRHVILEPGCPTTCLLRSLCTSRGDSPVNYLCLNYPGDLPFAAHLRTDPSVPLDGPRTLRIARSRYAEHVDVRVIHNLTLASSLHYIKSRNSSQQLPFLCLISLN